MADYRDYAAEERGAQARAAEERNTGFRRNRFHPAEVTCLACGCAIGDEKIHRERCPWTTEAPPPGGPWTTHGHDIVGVTVAGAGRPPVARCGGPRICKDCALDAERARHAHRQSKVAQP